MRNTDSEIDLAIANLNAKTPDREWERVGDTIVHSFDQAPRGAKRQGGPALPSLQLSECGISFPYSLEREYRGGTLTFSDPLAIREMANAKFDYPILDQAEYQNAAKMLSQKTGVEWKVFLDGYLDRPGAWIAHEFIPGESDHMTFADAIKRRDEIAANVRFIPNEIINVSGAQSRDVVRFSAMYSNPLLVRELSEQFKNPVRAQAADVLAHAATITPSAVSERDTPAESAHSTPPLNAEELKQVAAFISRKSGLEWRGNEKGEVVHQGFIRIQGDGLSREAYAAESQKLIQNYSDSIDQKLGTTGFGLDEVKAISKTERAGGNGNDITVRAVFSTASELRELLQQAQREATMSQSSAAAAQPVRELRAQPAHITKHHELKAESAESDAVNKFFTKYSPGNNSFWKGKDQSKITMGDIIQHAIGGNKKGWFGGYSGANTKKTLLELGVNLTTLNDTSKSSEEKSVAAIKQINSSPSQEVKRKLSR